MSRLVTTIVVVVLLPSCGSTAARPTPASTPEAAGAAPRITRPAAQASTAAPEHPPTRARFVGSIARIDAPTRRHLLKKNWHPGCPVPLRDLRVVNVSYWGFNGEVKSGPLVLNESVAEDVLGVFRTLFRHRFPIKRIALAAKYHPPRPSDYHSHRDVTASFNCRPVTENPGALSQHSYGWAIDINPLQNPYVRSDGTVLRRPALAYLDRTQDLPGMIHAGDVVVRAFARIGWGWGGDFQTIKDYMHFSLTGT
jgi:hypothetical protein